MVTAQTPQNKTALRDQLMTARNRRPLAEVGAQAAAIAEAVLAVPEVRRAGTVAAYVSIGTEPGTTALLESLVAQGKRILLPVVQPDLDLDWAVHTGDLVTARMGLLEPTGPTVGVDAIGWADVVLLPGLAVDGGGYRLGRGGGCYDRALGRVPVGTPTIVLLYEGEVVDQVPTEPHDRPVTHVATPAGVVRLRA
ncbi:5-formyltetrahydrofolate cyclo-ligase [Nocardioides sp.]|uniref:5-formyltetrahydrofolate cyclo-ligase n=1 Tax=Nocardioides sp. TaxID=35761 RepID=UPI003D0CF82E